MAKIIKVMVGNASFVKEEEFPDEATAQKGENPTTEKFTVKDISMEFTRREIHIIILYHSRSLH